MGIFGKGDETSDHSSGATIVAAGSVVNGGLDVRGSVHLDGVVEGRLRCSGEVIIGSRGLLKGELVAQRVLVSGEIDGCVNADRLEIVAGGKVCGELKVRELQIESGGRYLCAQGQHRQITLLKPMSEAVTNVSASFSLPVAVSEGLPT